MNFENLKDIIKNTRSTRRFDSSYKIKTDEIIEVVECARTVSSAKNMQPLKYLIANEKKSFDIIHKPLTWASHLKEWNQSNEEKPSAYILVLEDKNIDGYTMLDTGIALQTIMLSFTAKGLSSCPLASIDKELYKKEFNLPNHLEPLLAIAIGKSTENIKLVELTNNPNYYRDEKDTHCVPKRKLEDILFKVYE